MVSDSELKQIIDTAGERWGRPFVTASDVAEEVGMTRQGVHRRLENLHEAGELRKYKPGRGVIWWREGG